MNNKNNKNMTDLIAEEMISNLKYNAMEGQWEKTHPDSQLKLNPSTGDFQYVPPGSKLEYNPYSSEFEFAQ